MYGDTMEIRENHYRPANRTGDRRVKEGTKQREDLAMKTIRIGSVACALAIIASVSVTPSQAQPAAPSTQTALAKEAGTLSDKFAGLARVMAGKYDWKPGEGGRSVSDVFNLIVAENGVLTKPLTGEAAGDRPAPITDPEKLQDALKTSYANVRKAIEGLSDADLKAPVKIFGKDMTKEEA